MNQKKSMAYLPESERQSLIDWIRLKLKTLANISSLEFTSLYGTRCIYVISAIAIISVDNSHLSSKIRQIGYFDFLKGIQTFNQMKDKLITQQQLDKWMSTSKMRFIIIKLETSNLFFFSWNYNSTINHTSRKQYRSQFENMDHTFDLL
ncbi:hypothetical protein RFI_35221 [Reticulomyxa filosa]|uniref:Uncharacterized protein n=1 Tax=Reticulomyxa filosa TaxID=46433 RepID=X6LLH3_RETFI|nr:hypothetical protein RFI_35221 [Reticulomyxa filosa]|eukprot:ETO02216.1 hypothetical protein RFI_35221 [Reticulomyxa filosa]